MILIAFQTCLFTTLALTIIALLVGIVGTLIGFLHNNYSFGIALSGSFLRGALRDNTMRWVTLVLLTVISFIWAGIYQMNHPAINLHKIAENEIVHDFFSQLWSGAKTNAEFESEKSEQEDDDGKSWWHRWKVSFLLLTATFFHTFFTFAEVSKEIIKSTLGHPGGKHYSESIRQSQKRFLGETINARDKDQRKEDYGNQDVFWAFIKGKVIADVFGNFLRRAFLKK